MKAEDILIYPLNRDKFAAYIVNLLDAAGLKQENTEYSVMPEGMAKGIDNLVLDDECCYVILERNGLINADKISIEIFHDVTVNARQLIATSPDGKTKSYSHTSFDVRVSLSKFNEFLSWPVSLPAFMGSRYNYNPRIQANTREFINTIRPYLENAKRTDI